MDYPAEAVIYIRVSLATPKPGNEERVSQLMDDMLTFLPSQPGYVRGYKILSGDPEGRLGRIGVYESEAAADHAAQTDHILAVRSELMQLIEEDSHSERSYTAFDPSHPRS